MYLGSAGSAVSGLNIFVTEYVQQTSPPLSECAHFNVEIVFVGFGEAR